MQNFRQLFEKQNVFWPKKVIILYFWAVFRNFLSKNHTQDLNIMLKFCMDVLCCQVYILAKFQACSPKTECFTAKKRCEFAFSVLFRENVCKNSYLKFELEAENWHGDSLRTREQVCKISGRLIEAFGCSLTKYLRGPKAQNFWTHFSRLLRVFFMFYG